MTVRSVLMNGVRLRHEHGGAVKLEMLARLSQARFDLLVWTLEARRLNLRTANRRMRRRSGLSFENA